MPSVVLIVDSQPSFAAHLDFIARSVGWSPLVRHSFATARGEITSAGPAMLVTAVKLGEFNGLHLVYLMKLTNRPAPCLVFGADDFHLQIGSEAQQAGAFYERRSTIAAALGRYLTASALPALDRRDISRRDRRAQFRGGRRATDVAVLQPRLVQ